MVKKIFRKEEIRVSLLRDSSSRMPTSFRLKADVYEDVADNLGVGHQTLYSLLHEASTGVLSGISEVAHEITPQESEIA